MSDKQNSGVYSIKKIAHPKLDKLYKKSMKELNSFFEIDWIYNCPRLLLVPDRETIDSLRGRKSEGWLVGWAANGNVYVLNAKNFEKESNHTYSDKEYFSLIKHELAHCFSSIVSDRAQKPIWLLEGISMYVSGQTALKTKPKKFETFLNYFDEGGKGVYSEAGFAVLFLVEKFGKEKLLLLLKKTKDCKTKKSFANVFKSIYHFELTYANFKIL